MKALLLILALATSCLADAPKWSTDVSKAISQAGRENKMSFILLGRVACSNCQATRKMINESTVPVTADTFVIADINVDDQRSRGEFDRKFKKEKFGDVLPFVVITDSHGKALASYNGYKTPADLTAIIEGAKAKFVAAGNKQ